MLAAWLLRVGEFFQVGFLVITSLVERKRRDFCDQVTYFATTGYRGVTQTSKSIVEL